MIMEERRNSLKAIEETKRGEIGRSERVTRAVHKGRKGRKEARRREWRGKERMTGAKTVSRIGSYSQCLRIGDRTIVSWCVIWGCVDGEA